MRLTDKQKAEVIKEFAAGKSKSDIARKFNISVTAVSKILKSYESSKNGEKFNLKSLKSSAEIRKDIISRAETALSEKEFHKLAPETLLKIIERLSTLEENKTTDSNNKAVVEFVFKDTSLKEDEKADNNT